MVPHTVVVDFAVGLLVTSVVFDCLAHVAEEEELVAAAWWTLLFGTLAAAFSVLSGFDAASTAPGTSPVAETIVLHRNCGMVGTVAFAICAGWRGACGGALPTRFAPLYWSLSLAGVAALVVTAYYGGTLVFRYGVGVAAP